MHKQEVKSQRRWTKEEESILKDLVKEKVLLKEIAKKLNRTEKSVSAKILNMRLASKFKRPEQEIRHIAEEGKRLLRTLPLTRAAETLGVPPSTLRRALKKYHGHLLQKTPINNPDSGTIKIPKIPVKEAREITRKNPWLYRREESIRNLM